MGADRSNGLNKRRKLHNLPWDIIGVLATENRGLTFKELAFLTRKNKSTVADNVSVLEDAGLVKVGSRKEPKTLRSKRWVRVVELADDLPKPAGMEHFFATIRLRWLSA